MASLVHNAFHVLGLDGTSTVKQANQRANEIIQRLKIEDLPIYALDLLEAAEFRNEKTTRDALQFIQSPKARLQEYFFWFRIEDNIDQAALAKISEGDFQGAIRVWELATKKSSTAIHVYGRNLAMAKMVVISSVEELRSSLSAWKALLDSDDFWTAFGSEYLRTGDALSHNALMEFRNLVKGYLSDIYLELQEVKRAKSYLYEFGKVFEAKGSKIGKEVLAPIYEGIERSTVELEGVSINEGDRYDLNLGSRIKALIAAIQNELNKLVEAGYYDASESKILRDQASGAIRRLAIAVHNFMDERVISGKLIAIATTIAGTDSQRALLATDEKAIRKNLSSEQSNTFRKEVPAAQGGGTTVLGKKLEFDLGFLEKGKFPATNAASVQEPAHKDNSTSIILFALMAAAALIWFAASNGSSQRTSNYTYDTPVPASVPSSPAAAPTPSSPAAAIPSQVTAPAQVSEPSNLGEVQNGQFMCSHNDSTQAELLAPRANTSAINNEGNQLAKRQEALDALGRTIRASPITQFSSQLQIDKYNQLVDQYNNQLTSIKADMGLYNQHLDAFNRQVDAYNNFLATHCRRRN